MRKTLLSRCIFHWLCSSQNQADGHPRASQVQSNKVLVLVLLVIVVIVVIVVVVVVVVVVVATVCLFFMFTYIWILVYDGWN